jgi:hypothetical protein
MFGLPSYARLDPVVLLAAALVPTFWGVILATPADGERMLVCPSSQRTRRREGSSWSTSSITPARLGCAALSDSTTILSPTWTPIYVSPLSRFGHVVLSREVSATMRIAKEDSPPTI